jgi:hypothetical protein
VIPVLSIVGGLRVDVAGAEVKGGEPIQRLDAGVIAWLRRQGEGFALWQSYRYRMMMA